MPAAAWTCLDCGHEVPAYTWTCPVCAETEERLAEMRAYEDAAGAVCTICQAEWVDVLNGEDTCPRCLKLQSL